MKMTRLLLMPLAKEQDVVECRNRARKLAAGCDFDAQDQIRIATAVSEIARNAFRYARGATAEFAFGTADGGPAKGEQQLQCIVRDQGPGIANLEQILAGSYRSSTGMGMGILGARRLMDLVDVQTSEKGTVVKLGKNLPRRKTVNLALLDKAVADISRSQPVNPMDEISAQNQELVRMLEEVRTHHEDLAGINEELRETNRGVVALYDELDTIHRLGKVVASKLDRELLLEAITQATTELSGADLGAFFFRDLDSQNVVRFHAAGPLLPAEAKEPPLDFAYVWPSGPQAMETQRIDDLKAQPATPIPAGLNFEPRSSLRVPVADAEGRVVGGLIFLHRLPGAFTERTERILATVAVQAAMGLENSRLYHNVSAANAAKDHFISTLSHELRTPLNPIFAILSNLEENSALSAEVQEELATLRRNLELEARLIDDMLDLTRIARGEFPLHMAVMDLHEVLRSAYETCRTSAEAKGIVVRWDLRAAVTHVNGDAARLQQVFWNLMGNAVKFSPVGARMEVTTSLVNQHAVRVSIRDHGRGIAPESIGQIFQPFEQGDTAVAGQFGGLGLGLAISKGIVNHHKGSIEASSAGRGMGSTFSVTLPVTSAPVSRPASIPLSQTPPLGIRILLVDDHKDTRNSLRTVLVKRGHSVILAASCEEALACSAKQPFDLVISDLGLPDGTGHELMIKLKAAHSIRGIALSGYGMEADINRSLKAGFDTHLTKPVNIPALDAAIAQVMAAAAARPRPPAEVND